MHIDILRGSCESVITCFYTSLLLSQKTVSAHSHLTFVLSSSTSMLRVKGVKADVCDRVSHAHIENRLILESQVQHELRLSEKLNTSFKKHAQYKTDSICHIMSEYTHPSVRLKSHVAYQTYLR